MDRFSRICTVQFGPGEEKCRSCYDPFGHHRFLGRKGWTPHTDILETEKAVIIVMELAGVDKEQIKIVFEEEILRVSGVRARKQLPGVKKFHRMEVDYGPFEKLFRVPQELDSDRIEAAQKNGFLEISLPKKKAEEPIRVVIVHEDSY